MKIEPPRRSFAARCRAARHLPALVAATLLAACAAPGVVPAGPAAASPEAASASALLSARSSADPLYERGEWSAAAEAYERVVALAPRHAIGWLRLGNCRMRLADLDRAALAFQQAARVDPADGRASYNLALARIAQADAALRQARAPGARLGVLAGEARRLQEVTRWLSTSERTEVALP